MTRRTWWIAGGIVGVLSLVLAFLWLNREGEDFGPVEDLTDPTAQGASPLDEAVEPLNVDLYFPGEGGQLYRESRSLPRLGDPSAQIKLLIQALLEGPQSGSLRAPLSDGAQLRQVYLLGGDAASTLEVPKEGAMALAGQTVVLDFETEGAQPPRSTGSQRERLMAYSLVNSILLNFDGGRGVIILWNGEQNVTFGGHLDTGRPLGADRSLVAKQAPPPYDPEADEVPELLPTPTAEAAPQTATPQTVTDQSPTEDAQG